MSKIVLEDFNEGDGYYKINLAYLSKEQVEEIEALVSRWKPTDEDIKNCIIMCLTDADEQRFKDYGTNLKDCLTWLEKQSKQKPVDKVEPKKFKVGDWIILSENHNSIYQIERIDNYRYYLRHYLGGTLSVHFDNELIRLWTIKDAKDGDVLFDGSNILLFKEVNHWNNITSYLAYSQVYGIREYFISGSDVITPAIKEQRELLFQKMKENRYEWDSEKKELRMLEKQGEQKPADKVEPKFHEGDWVIYKNEICQIVKREEGCNKLVTTFGIEKELVNERNLSTARLWTIQDAKDGDVLIYNYYNIEWILIFKNIIPTKSYNVPHDVLNYHALFTSTDFYDSGTATMIGENYGSYFTPATKEQRGILKKAMSASGYEWDAEKKELSKINY